MDIFHEKGLILVVEHDPEINEFIVNSLSINYEVVRAFDGKEGLEKATKQKPDLILTDLKMPKMNGDEMIKEIKNKPKHADIPIIILTAKSDDSIKNKLLGQWAQDYVLKPFSSEELQARVNNVMNIQRAARRARDLERALMTRDEFLSIASHELKTPLSSLKLQLQMTSKKINPELKSVPGAEQLAKFFSVSLRHVESLISLVDELLDVSKVGSGRMTYSFEPVDLSLLVQETMDVFSEQLKLAQCSLELNLENSVLGHWDKNRIGQIIVNLLSNAIKYASGHPIKIETYQKGPSAILTVQDFGPGIPLEKQNLIFNRFERGGASQSVGGLGLGLFITKKIIEDHNGTIRLESQLGQGSKFIVELPLNPLDIPETYSELHVM